MEIPESLIYEQLGRLMMANIALSSELARVTDTQSNRDEIPEGKAQ